jgi:hypothetical protein
MPQQRNIVPLVLQNAPPGQAVATGNNAAWHCACQSAPLLVGRTFGLTPTPANEVVCPACNRRFFVEPIGSPQKSVSEVREL